MAGIRKTFKVRRSADRNGPLRLLVFDFGASSTRMLLMSRNKQAIKWEKAVLLPPLRDDNTFGPEHEPLDSVLRREKIDAEYVSILISSGVGMFRLINFPGKPADAAALLLQVRQTLGVDDTYTVRCQVLQESGKEKGGREEFTVMAAALSSELVQRAQAWLAGNGLKPVSMQVSGVAAANLIHDASGVLADGKATGLVEIGSASSHLMIFQGRELALARQFKFGSAQIIETLKSSFDLDQETALKFYSSGSFDFSGNVKPVMAPWLHQLGISLDFFERRYGAKVGDLRLFGGGSSSKVIETLISEHVGRPLTRWNPLDALHDIALPKVAEDVNLERFASAAGDGARVILSGNRTHATV